MSIDPISVNIFNAFAAACAAVAAIASAFTAHSAYKYQQRLEKNKLQLLKNEVAVKHIHELMFAFSEIRAISESEWSDGRTNKLNQHANALRKKITIIGSLHPDSGNRLDSWSLEKDYQGNSISSVVDYELGNLGAAVGNKYNEFFKQKSSELRHIQDLLFAEFSA